MIWQPHFGNGGDFHLTPNGGLLDNERSERAGEIDLNRLFGRLDHE
jgi:hypothetical protein